MSGNRHVVVIGSGHSGALSALTLLQKGIPVTLLETGLVHPGGLLVRMMGKNIYRKKPGISDNRHVASGDPKTLWHHALVPGGLSNNWAGAVPRFAPGDFHEGERLHERYRWPVSYDDLVPYYEHIERLAGVVGEPRDVPQLPASIVAHPAYLPKLWQSVAKHAEAFGNGLTLLPRADVRSWTVVRSGASFDSFHRILPILQRSPHFRLLLGAHALRLEWSSAKKKVSSVTYFDKVTQSEQRLECSAVVLAAGALSSTKLLLDSACADFPEGLGNTEGLLGRYLHDHPMDWVVVELDKSLPRLERNAYLTRNRYSDSQPLLAAASGIGNASPRDKIPSIVGLKTHVFGAQVYGTMVPIEEHSVRLHPESRDEFGLPLLDINIRFHEDELKNIVSARERLVAILDSAGYRSRVTYSNPEFVPGTSVHYGGTVRMHSLPKYGMLNAWNRLHAVDNVVVADMSCFTTGPEKNPALTTMALAARAADRLAEDLKTFS